MDPANKRVQFPPREIYLDDNNEQMRKFDNEFLLSTVESTGEEEEFDDESTWELTEHTLDMKSI